ncbi:glyceraldehyde-3-phosphate dehydrogenase, putative [Eimeria tenella]|uniref:Glyceraldehyde-3-phosphate dehydrogenase, putative n=1 Tax=Eimeria tenella TaxID=5802 RepID=U6KT28_EIMTE|nr:glyceraldehyde-3-phosphate dehydrogenase, putative [Eimeria tenella]CDJ38578.1 glyceraldehyde-3-phosphate dehydrogenase, putative [Eimeria tenella]|eukprot:XP_013229416.1 glyceraldehyde-3-phosphate dehydrogenase, putative [Eimeria tenella]
MRVCLSLCLGAAALLPAYGLKLVEDSKTLNPKPSDEGLVFEDSQQQLQQEAADEAQAAAPAAAAAAAAEAQLFAEAAAAAADDDDAAAAQSFADAAAEAANQAATLAAAAAANEEDEQQQQQQQEPIHIFAPRQFRFTDPAGGKALTVYFHNTFEPFDWLSCSALHSLPSVCRQHPRSVVIDAMQELGSDPQPLLAALEEAGAANPQSICGLVKELATELLATERNLKPLPEGAVVETLNPSEGLEEGLDEGRGSAGKGLNAPRLVNPKPHLQIYSSSAKPATGTAPGTEPRIRIGINGFGRIGRLVFRIASKRKDMAVTHINSSLSAEYLAYLIKHDSVHGRFKGQVESRDGKLFFENNEIKLSKERDPSSIRWTDTGADFVCESTGAFCTFDLASKHVNRPEGARHVVISAPAKDEVTPTLVVGVNAETEYSPEMKVVSCASCTTNGLAPLLKVLDENFGIEEGLMTTVHAVTSSQKTVDAASSGSSKARSSSSSSSSNAWRSNRAAGGNIIPAATGAAKAVARCLPQLKGKITGMAVRVPTLDVSLIDLTCRLQRSSSYSELLQVVKAAAAAGPLRGLLGYTEQPVVSSDILGTECSTVFDANAGIMLNPNFVKLISWYDNEASYAARLVDLIAIMAAKDGLVEPGVGLNRKTFDEE